MARFPLKEAEVIALAQSMVSGLTANAATYPAPPVLPAALTTLVSAYTTAKNAATQNSLQPAFLSPNNEWFDVAHHPELVEGL
jgi:hypothetical protein